MVTMMRRTLAVLSAALVVAGAMMPAGAWFMDRRMSRDVIMIVPHDSSVVEMNRLMWEKGGPVAEVYGQPSSKPVRVFRPRAEDIVIPAEDPSLTLLKVPSGAHVVQVQSLWFFAKMAGIPCALAGILGLALWKLLSRRAAV